MDEKIILPPQNIEAEAAVLGSILLDGKSMDRVADMLKPESFYKMAHAQIYKKMKALYLIGKPIDTLTLSDMFTGDQLEKVGGAYFLTGLVEAIPSASNIMHYAEMVIDKWREREIRNKCLQVAQDIDNGNTPDDLEAELLALFSSFDKSGGYQSVSTYIPEVNESIKKLEDSKGVVRGLRTGLSDLDKYTGGLQPADLVILAGRPSMGKTSLGMTIARNLGMRGKRAAVASIEMTAKQLTERLVLQQASVDSHKYQTGYLSKTDVVSLRKATDDVKEWPVWVDDSTGMDMLDIHSRIRRLNVTSKVDLLIIDYLQRMTDTMVKGMSKNDLTGLFAKQAKSLAKDLNIPVMLLSQLSRETEKRHGKHKRPMMSDLRDSGEIEQEADQIWLLYRPEQYDIHVDKDGGNIDGTAEIIIAKNRNGRTGTVHVAFQKDRMRFGDLSRAGEYMPIGDIDSDLEDENERRATDNLPF